MDKEKKPKERRNFSLFLQIALLFSAAAIVTAIVTNLSILQRSVRSVKEQTEIKAATISHEVMSGVREFQAFDWLVSYWRAHAGELDIEYDTDFAEGTKTKEKILLLQSHEPGFMIRYADEEQIAALSEEDQKLYAEIAYSWIITRMNDIKSDNAVSFLFCVVPEDNYGSQYFLLSAGDGVTERGTGYEQIYTLGVTVPVNVFQSGAMKDAVKNESHLSAAGTYMDYYSLLGMDGDDPVLTGITFDMGGLLDNVFEEAVSGAAFSAVIITAIAVLCLLMIVFVVIRPVKKIQKGIRNYIGTKDSEQVAKDLSGIKQKNEIGKLADDVVDLASEIDDYLEHIRAITEEKGRIESELDMGASIQMSMMPQEFPPFPNRREFDIHAFIEPAKEVGGDFYDFFFIDDDHLGLMIADVSGKGVPAALFMMISKVILQSCAMLGKTADEILQKTNEALCSNNKTEMFVTVWIGILEISTGKLTASGAGHENPVFRKNGERFRILKNKQGLVIGVVDGVTYPRYEIQLEPGDTIFVYTDGLAEATDAGQNMFGTKRIEDVLNERPDAAPKELIDTMKEAVDGFVKEAEQFDDLTMLCMRYNGTAKNK